MIQGGVGWEEGKQGVVCVNTDSDSGWSWLGRGEEDKLVHARFDQTQPSWLAALKLEATYTLLNTPFFTAPGLDLLK